MTFRPDLTAKITVDDVGDATTTITGNACDDELIVDRADAWTRIIDIATQTGRPLLVRTVDEHGRSYRDVVTPAIPADDERTTSEAPRESSDPAAPLPARHTSPEPGMAVTTTLESGYPSPLAEHRDAFPQPDAEDHGHTEPDLPVTPAGDWFEPESQQFRAPMSADDAKDGAAGGHRRDLSHRRLLVAGAGMLLCVTLAAAMLSPGRGETVAVTKEAAEPRPDGQDDEPPEPPAWHVVLAAGTRPTITPAGLVAAHSRAGHIQLIDPDTGSVEWRADAGDDASSPVAFSYDNRDAVAWQRPGQLVVGGPATDPSPVTYRLNDGARISNAGTQLLVTDPGRPDQVLVVTESGLTKVTIPDDATAMAAVGNHVVSSNGHPKLWRSPIHGGETDEVPLHGPAEMTPHRWAGMAGDTVTVVWAAPGSQNPDGEVIVMAHDAATGQPLASIGARWGDVAEADLTAAPGPRSVALGPAVLPLTEGREPLTAPGVRWVRYVNSQLWGVRRGDGRVVRLDKAGVLHVLPDGARMPYGITDEGACVVVDGDTVYALSAGSETPDSRSSGNGSKEPPPDSSSILPRRLRQQAERTER
ncbi:hypothetical protein G1H11_16080 [Phytoactinopolyspora alkaliphila]|uniref:Uncharacterized protein n=1 Tax=Phytoactinopolyspora alkaliphila TaxID=1783498 RepID=A0A6N9YPF1_9ACTN|nr:hypothetical protein [Phytoactinopolyspora alkaliphila]NED96827.1 hypothetical protein [Phytoactinopolyspora alkaliphila]